MSSPPRAGTSAIQMNVLPVLASIGTTVLVTFTRAEDGALVTPSLPLVAPVRLRIAMPIEALVERKDPLAG